MEGNEPVVSPTMRDAAQLLGCSILKNGERKVGDPARRQAITNPHNTIASVKRFMGRRFRWSGRGDHHWSYKVSEGDNNTVRIDMPDGRLYTPPGISAMVLQKMKTAELPRSWKWPKLWSPLPAYFNDAQRQATKEAGEIAGHRSPDCKTNPPQPHWPTVSIKQKHDQRSPYSISVVVRLISPFSNSVTVCLK